MFKLILCLTVAIKLAVAQYQGIIWEGNQQYYQPQPQYNNPLPHIQHDEKYREAGADEPVVGSPLLPGLLKPRIFPLGVPGLRFSNLNAGHIGGLMFGNSLLGSSNPMAEDEAEKYQSNSEYQVSSPNQYSSYNLGSGGENQADPQISAQPEESSVKHGKIFWKKWASPDGQPDTIIGGAPSCGQSYQNYQFSSPQAYQVSSPQTYQVSSPQTYQISSPQTYQVSSQQNYQEYPQQYTYPAYQSALPQIYNQYQVQQNEYEGRNSQQYYEYPQQIQPAEPIVQPSGTYDESEKADERTWDWHWDKDDKKGDKKDKFKGKFNKDKFHKGAHIEHTHYHVPVQPHYHEQPIYPKPVYTKPAPVQNYNNYYNSYRSQNPTEAEQPLEAKSEVVNTDSLTITTTEIAPSNKSTTLSSCFSTNEITTKSLSTTTADDNNTTTLTTTEKSEKKNKDDKQKSKKFNRRRRSVQSGSTNNKRCIKFTDPIFLGVPVLGAPNPNADDSDSTSQDSENCESGNCSDSSSNVVQPNKPPVRIIPTNDRIAQQIIDRMRDPYLGAIADENKKLWNNDGILGRVMGPLEDTYLDFVKHQETMPQIQEIRIVT